MGSDSFLNGKNVVGKAVLTLYSPGLFIHCSLLFPPPGIALLSIISCEESRVSPVSTVSWDDDSSLSPALLAVILFCFSQRVTTTAVEAPLLLLGKGRSYTAWVRRAGRNEIRNCLLASLSCLNRAYHLARSISRQDERLPSQYYPLGPIRI